MSDAVGRCVAPIDEVQVMTARVYRLQDQPKAEVAVQVVAIEKLGLIRNSRRVAALKGLNGGAAVAICFKNWIVKSN